MDEFFGAVEKKIRSFFKRFKAFVIKLLFPLYLFPVKLATYSAYYLVKFTLKTIISLIKIFFETLIYPFRGLRNFLKSIFILGLVAYVILSLAVIGDYLQENYGNYSKFFCGINLNRELNDKVVRIVGGLSEGSGFFIQENQVVTSFHVIADEPSPKVIFPGGNFETPEKIIGSPSTDIAILFLSQHYPEYALSFMEPVALYEDEPLFAAGYPLGTDLAGGVTITRGRFAAFRESKKYPEVYIQTDISLIEGMSGGPIVDRCGQVVGVNTAGVAGASFFISADSVIGMMPYYSEQEIAKIEVDPSTPEGAVEAFYTYLKARRMEDGFNLLSQAYLQKTNFQEWTNRFRDVLDVQIYGTRLEDERRNIVFVKFSTKNWVEGEAEQHFYEGIWETIREDGIYKMYRSNIKEVPNPEWDWFYNI